MTKRRKYYILLRLEGRSMVSDKWIFARTSSEAEKIYTRKHQQMLDCYETWEVHAIDLADE